MDLPEYLERTADQVDKLIDRYFASETGENSRKRVHTSSLQAGKRLGRSCLSCSPPMR